MTTARYGRATHRAGVIAVVTLWSTLCLPYDATAQILARVKERGAVVCGVSQGLPGFSTPDNNGQWTGINVDLCRGIAAAIVNDSQKESLVPLAAKNRFTALQVNEIDVLSHDTTWTLSRAPRSGLLSARATSSGSTSSNGRYSR